MIGPAAIAYLFAKSLQNMLIYAVVPFKHKIGALTRVRATRAQHIAEGQEDADAAIVFVRTRSLGLLWWP